MSLSVPQEPFLATLFQLWERHPNKTLIRQYLDGPQEATVAQFLHDVLTAREKIWTTLSSDARGHLRDEGTNVFVALLVGPEYPFFVLVFALYSLGVVTVPLSPAIRPDEALYFLKLCHTSLVITSSNTQRKGDNISNTSGILNLTIDMPPQVEQGSHFHMQLEHTARINPQKGFVLLYTSGTTGPPKGILLSRAAAESGITGMIQKMGFNTSDTYAHYSPVHWIAGFRHGLSTILGGACLELCASVFSSDWMLDRWERMAQGDAGITCWHPVPSVLQSVGDSLEAVRKTGPIGSARIPPAIRAFWRDLREGKPLTIAYGLTEMMGFVSISDWQSDDDVPPDCCGSVCPNTELIIHDGELCIKSPLLLERYLSEDPEVMKKAFTAEGYYKTGDLGKLEGDQVFVFGRASHDVIRFDGWKLMAPDVESELAEHPLISQAVVVGVNDCSVGQRVAALAIVDDTSLGDRRVQLPALRRWLAIERRMNAYKLPTLLRLIGKQHELPSTPSGKVLKPKIRDLFFSSEALGRGLIQLYDLDAREGEIGNRPFDWAGIQAKAVVEA
ncbi:hypothetical protein BDV25DRAFT_128695 [Aspergillus avenaceus]|uniref:Acetyl-CoA synthetase-like protein n=1 Tax=Aspergillus avenaceus TaxID=36643 RepID=A0A5N6TYR8_ASPAV|nr:hypothetical protein BDV25DRAFT_128695 [Aspergillus avenaceus]